MDYCCVFSRLIAGSKHQFWQSSYLYNRVNMPAHLETHIIHIQRQTDISSQAGHNTFGGGNCYTHRSISSIVSQFKQQQNLGLNFNHIISYLYMIITTGK